MDIAAKENDDIYENDEEAIAELLSEFQSDDVKFGIGVRDENEPNHWKETSDISFADKKTILILPGSGTNSAKEANGMCKIVQKMLPQNKTENFQICSMYYTNANASSGPAVVRAQKLLDEYIIPLVATKDKNGDLHRISAQEAAHNMRNLMVVTHCYGSYILQEIDKHLNYMMEDLGYLADERKFIQKQLIVAQHNNIDTDLGEKDTHFTNFIRLSSSDEDVSVKETKLGMFYNYIKSKEPAKGDALYLKLTDNSRVLLVEMVTKLGVSDHNGGYWKNAVYKTPAGKKEEQLFNAIFQEAADSNYLIENAEQILENAAAKHPDSKELIIEAFTKGKEYGKEAKNFARSLKDEYQKAERNLASDDFQTAGLSEEVLLMYNENDEFLLDKALSVGKIKSAEKITVAMFDKLPKLHFTKFQYEEYRPYIQNKNEENALNKAQKWAQQAIELDSGAMFGVISNRLPVNKFKKLNFEFASEQIMSIAVNEILQKDNPGSLDRQEYFSQAFTNIYARVEKLPESENRNEMLKRLNQRVFAPANGIQKPMSYYMLERMLAFAVEKNVAGLQKVLQNCAELKNSAKTHSSMIKDVNMR